MSQKVLIIDDVVANRIVTKVKLAAAHYAVLSATSAEDGLKIARTERPQLVIAEATLHEIAPHDLCRSLRAIGGMADAGIIMVTADETLFSRADALSAGADEVLCRPLDDRTLMPLVRSLARRHRTADDLANHAARLGMVPEAPGAFSYSEMAELHDSSGLVLVVSADGTRAAQLKAMLSGHIRDRLSVLSLDDAAEALTSPSPPDLLLLDVGTLDTRMAVGRIAELHYYAAARNTSVVVVTAYNDPETAALARDLGACDALPFGTGADELTARVRAQLKRKRESDMQRHSIDEGLRLAAIDPLTGLLNRRAGLLALDRLVAMTRAQGQPLALLAIDIDGFKQANDTFGHAGGDAVLRTFAERIAGTLRANDLFARLGGDEFIIALPGSHEATSRLVAERIRRLIDGKEFQPTPGDKLHCTVSIGIAMAEPQDRVETAALVNAADQAMYRAKSAGRNSVKGRSAA
jgi:two-component system cell cycle response regulator